MKHVVILFFFICQQNLSDCYGKFDFGLFENEPFLKAVALEDSKISSVLEEYNKKYQDKTLNQFLHSQKIFKKDFDFIHHPINAYFIIKKYAHVYPGMVEKLISEELQYKIKAQINATERIQHISQDDFSRSINALVQIIFSYDLDIDKFAKGIIQANLYGNGQKDLISEKQLFVDDLYNIATQAMEFGYLGIAGSIIKAALKAPTTNDGDKVLVNKMEGMAKNIVKLHNGNMERWRSVFTKNYVLRPYFLSDNLDKRSKQPKYIKSGKVNQTANISYYGIDGPFVSTSSMLQSCGAVRNKGRFLKKNKEEGGHLYSLPISSLIL